MKKFTPKGTFTALVTPFKKSGEIDFNTLQLLIDFQAENGIDGIVVCGSTGESATMSEKEKIAVIDQSVKFANGKIHIIAGTGTYETEATRNFTIIAKELGASAALIVAPYYNKPTQDGLFEHYAISVRDVNMPIIIYNIPGRTGVNITVDTQLKLAASFPNIVATKEASGNLDQVMNIISKAPEHFSVLSGDDQLTLPMMAIGAKGVVSVISNYAPKKFAEMVALALKGKFIDAAKIHYELYDLMKLNVIETNPIPVKAAMAMMDMIKDPIRMPLLNLTKENSKLMKEALIKAGLLNK